MPSLFLLRRDFVTRLAATGMAAGFVPLLPAAFGRASLGRLSRTGSRYS